MHGGSHMKAMIVLIIKLPKKFEIETGKPDLWT